MSEAKVRIAYTGTALQDGSMDVTDLAPALLAFAGFIQRANEVIGNKQPVKITLNADDIRKGSFDITLQLASNALQQARMLMGMADETGLQALLDLIGYGAVIYSGIFAIVKKCRGKKPESVEKTDDSVTMTFQNSSITVTHNEFNVYCDKEAREQLEKIMKPLAVDGIETFEVRNNTDIDDKKPVVAVAKSEKEFFVLPKEDEREEEYSDTQTMVFDIVSLSFGENYKWRFSDGDNIFGANIEDEEFMQRVATGEQTFRHGDKIQAECTTIQKVGANGNLTTKRIITKVLKYIPMPQQEKLF